MILWRCKRVALSRYFSVSSTVFEHYLYDRRKRLDGRHRPGVHTACLFVLLTLRAATSFAQLSALHG
jgi:hypothetical protein